MPLGYITIAEKILSAVKVLFGLKDSLAKARVERRTRMADLFEKVATCLEETAKELRAGSYPGGRCQELLTYAVELPAIVGDELGQAKAEEIGSALKAAHEVERLYADQGKPEGRENVAKLDEAAGLLRALGNIVRV